MLKKNNTPIEDVMKTVAKENGFTYVPPEKRTPKRLAFKKDASGNITVSLEDIMPKKKITGVSIEKHRKIGESGIAKSRVKLTYKGKRKSEARKSNGKSSTSIKNYG